MDIWAEVIQRYMCKYVTRRWGVLFYVVSASSSKRILCGMCCHCSHTLLVICQGGQCGRPDGPYIPQLHSLIMGSSDDLKSQRFFINYLGYDVFVVYQEKMSGKKRPSK